MIKAYKTWNIWQNYDQIWKLVNPVEVGSSKSIGQKWTMSSVWRVVGFIPRAWPPCRVSIPVPTSVSSPTSSYAWSQQCTTPSATTSFKSTTNLCLFLCFVAHNWPATRGSLSVALQDSSLLLNDSPLARDSLNLELFDSPLLVPEGDKRLLCNCLLPKRECHLHRMTIEFSESSETSTSASFAWIWCDTIATTCQLATPAAEN